MKKLLLITLLLLTLLSCTEYYRQTDSYLVELTNVNFGNNTYVFKFIATVREEERPIININPSLQLKIKRGEIIKIIDFINNDTQSEEDYFIFMEKYLGFSVKNYGQE